MKIDLSNRKGMFYWQTNRPLSASDTKTIFLDRHENIDSDILQQIVSEGMKSAGFTNSDTVVKNIHSVIKRGSVNSVIPISLISGKKIIVRIHPKDVINGYFWVEKIATDLARTYGVPTYETLYIDDTQKVLPFDYMIMSAVEGKPLIDLMPLSNEVEHKLIKETGKYAAMIHLIQTTGFGFYDNNHASKTQKLRGQYDSFKEHIFASLDVDVRFLIDFGVLTQEQGKKIIQLYEGSNTLMECKQGSLIHNDIADWNELSDGKEITGIMDWDECFSGDPLMEIAAYNLFFGEPRLSWFKEGYKEITQLEDNEDKFQLFKLRYLISKMHLRKKRSTIDKSDIMKQNLVRGMKAMIEVFDYFKF